MIRTQTPWTYYGGFPIYDGDIIEHLNGERGKVLFLSPYANMHDQWRVVYENDPRLGLQLGDKGMARIIQAELRESITPADVARDAPT